MKPRYNPQRVIGNHFEEQVKQMFGLINTPSKELPDLVSRTSPGFYVEVKAAALDNGGVIKEKQLIRYADMELLNEARFYAFCFHNLALRDGRLTDRFKNAGNLKAALSLHSFFLFPYSIVRAHFENGKQKQYMDNDFFVQLDKETAFRISRKDSEEWARIGLSSRNYKIKRPHKKVHIITREGHLEQQILSSFDILAI